MATITVTSNYFPLASDDVIFVDATSGPVNIYLPVNHFLGKRYEIKDKTGVAMTTLIKVVGASPDTIDGLPDFSLTMNFQSVIVHSDGTNWYIL
jgi:hypothetical protein